MDVLFSSTDGESKFVYASANTWTGLAISRTSSGLRLMDTTTWSAKTYTLDELGLESLEQTINIKCAIDLGEMSKDKTRDVTYTLWVNNKCIGKHTFANMAGTGNTFAIHANGSKITVSNPKLPVDFTRFGYTSNWEKEIGLK